jgi:hypothetical protein
MYWDNGYIVHEYMNVEERHVQCGSFLTRVPDASTQCAANPEALKCTMNCMQQTASASSPKRTLPRSGPYRKLEVEAASHVERTGVRIIDRRAPWATCLPTKYSHERRCRV